MRAQASCVFARGSVKPAVPAEPDNARDAHPGYALRRPGALEIEGFPVSLLCLPSFREEEGMNTLSLALTLSAYSLSLSA